MRAWHELQEAKNLKPGEMTHGRAGGEGVLVVSLAGELRAFANRCGHMNAPLDLGTFKSGVLKCPLPNAVFDARTGEVRGQPILTAPAHPDKLSPGAPRVDDSPGPDLRTDRVPAPRPARSRVVNGTVHVFV